ncbi:MAG TPA: glutamine-hydrolyzing GMP synthase [Bacteroidales bacterium]|nr:glutamine-hydrolyzing GMP synthase [Bacteroidales bacterium]HQB19238.1 glutamine-hydrolyzing GMP synthase [Bacteroidales bacterium]
MNEMILIVDFGSQYTQLIARKIREINTYCEIKPYHKVNNISDNVKGIILSGSPFSVYDEDAPTPLIEQWRKKIPILGICYGAQFLAYQQGGSVLSSSHREYGRANLTSINTNDKLFKNISIGSQVWMSHGDTITEIPSHFEILCSTENVKYAGFKIKDEATYGIQFHPEVHHSEQGKELLSNFVLNICKCAQTWTPDSFIDTTIQELKNQLQNDKVILGLSGGVDSTVVAYLLNKAIGSNLYGIFVDTGLLRKNEFELVMKACQQIGINVIGVKAQAVFYEKLKNVSNPEEKRKIIGNTFIEIFEKEAKKIKDVQWLAQGTIYPDVIESITIKGLSTTIKSHHNVGGLPERMSLKIVEPLRYLFKDEVRRVGEALGVPKEMLYRHPFPGPGLGIRILGDITEEKVRILQEVDAIFIQQLRELGWYDKCWQALAVLLPVKSVGVMGDKRTYENCVALRAVNSVDGMTADWVHLPYDILGKISNEIINNVRGVNRVVYDISSKPPATIEWE